MKSILLFVALVGSSILFMGCPNCRCPEVLPFTSWSDFWLRPDQAPYPAGIDSLNFTLEVIEMEYIAQEMPRNYGGDAAMACSCIDAGWRGFKSPLDSLVFTTISDWDVDHPAGSSLNDITQNYDYNYIGITPIEWTDFDDPTVIDGSAYEYFFTFRFTSRPAVAGSYDISAKMYFANGATVEGQSMTMEIQ